MKFNFKKSYALILAFLLALSIVFTGCQNSDDLDYDAGDVNDSLQDAEDVGSGDDDDTSYFDPISDGARIEDVKEYTGKPYAVLNNNQPTFTEKEITTTGYEFYSPLDKLGRCGYAMACVGKETMPTKPRGSISSVKPTGWINNMYDTDIVSGGSLYNRCHLIAFQLTGENANKQNLITGTRYMNVDGMLPFEDMVADYINETGNHVMYRATPIFEGNNLLASGVNLEAYSVEDNGEGICFNVYIYNVQPGIILEYASGANRLADPSAGNDDQAPENNLPGGTTPDINESDNPHPETNEPEGSDPAPIGSKYVLNKKSKKIHLPECASVPTIAEANMLLHDGPISDLIADGYEPCKNCNPQ